MAREGLGPSPPSFEMESNTIRKARPGDGDAIARNHLESARYSKTSSGISAETSGLGTSTTSDSRRSAATLQSA